MLIDVIKSIFGSTHGQMLIHQTKLPKDVREFEEEILNDLELKTLKEDKINLRNDSIRLKSDIKKSVDSYYTECAHG